MKKCLLVVLGLMLAGSVQAATWNLADDFSTTNNPNGDWTYGYFIGATFAPYQAQVTGTQDGSNYMSWETAGLDWLGGKVLKNLGPNVMDDWGYFEPGQVILHPGMSTTNPGDFMSDPAASARWTAPRDMTVDITALFTGLSSNTGTGGTTTTANVVYNVSNSLGGGYISGFYGTAANNYTDGFGTGSVSYAGQLNVLAGDTLDFVIYCNSNYACDATGLALTITEVPEPVTIGLLTLGGLLLRRRS